MPGGEGTEKSSRCRMGFLREAKWLNARRVRDYPRIFLVIYAIAIIIVLAASRHGIDQGRRPLGTDFMDVWAAGRLSLRGHPADAYDYKKHYAVQKAALPYKQDVKPPFFGWHYPPIFLLLATALAMLPYVWALFVWMAATLPMYLAAIRAIIPGRVAMTAALAFPGAFMTLGHGQNSFLTTALLGGGLVLLKKRPWIAGVLFGLLCYKPQFGMILPLALLAGGHWRAIFSAGFTVVAVCALSWLAFGTETWIAFFHSLGLTRHYVLEQGPTGWEKIESIFSAVRMLGGGIQLAYAAQMFESVFCTLCVIAVWRSPAVEDGLKYAMLVTAAMMSTPYILDYDLTAMALPMAWLAVTGLRDGFLPWEKITLVVMFVLPVIARLLGKLTTTPVGPVMMIYFLAMLLHRIVHQINAGKTQQEQSTSGSF
ncbi:MAG: DUF2029 domain-containing protein [Alphaproteobacteria bacterium]|nr:DUF2029 domain-containing protein [Alphaproteobacteria bacterium]